MQMPSLKIGDLKIEVPILLGAMGIGVTRANLAAAVTNAGGLGVISGVNLGFKEADFFENMLEANLRGLRNEIRKAKALTQNGLVGVNFMVAMNRYAEHVKEAVKEGVDIIVSGAGIPTELPQFVKGTSTKIAPIISSTKAARLITKVWDKKYQYAPDAIVLEGIKAGGHLGFSVEDIESNHYDMPKVVTEIKALLQPYEAKYNKSIPLIVAGGIFDGADMIQVLREGGDGVQMATRFVATEECDASEAFKQAYINAGTNDVKTIISPVGMPGRALSNPFLNQVMAGNRPPIERCVNCIKTCDPRTTPYCISQALINAVEGNVDEGLIFSGANVDKVKTMSSVKTIFEEIRTYLETHDL